MVLVPFILKHKSIISTNHILLLDQDVGHYDSEMIFQDWSFNRGNFHDRILHDPIQLGGYNNINGLKVNGGFLRTPHSLDWATMLGPI